MKNSPIIKFNFTHSYFNNKKFRNAKLVFCESCKKAVKGYNLFIHEESAGTFLLYIDGGENFNERMQFLAQDLCNNQNISFLFQVDSRLLCSITKDINHTSEQLSHLTISYKENLNKQYIVKDLIKIDKKTLLGEDIHTSLANKSLLHITLENSQLESIVFKEKILNEPLIEVNIHFETKSAIWKYIFIPRNRPQADIAVLDSRQLVTFTPVQWDESINNKKVGIAYSEKEIDYSENYQLPFQLWENHHNGKSLIIKQLSFPDPQYFGNYYQENGSNYISIFQYF